MHEDNLKMVMDKTQEIKPDHNHEPMPTAIELTDDQLRTIAGGPIISND